MARYIHLDKCLSKRYLLCLMEGDQFYTSPGKEEITLLDINNPKGLTLMSGDPGDFDISKSYP